MASCTEASVTSLVTTVVQGTSAVRSDPERRPPIPSPATPIGEWTVQAHPSSTCLGALEIFPCNSLDRQDKVRLVLDCQRKLVIAVDLTGTVKILAPLELLSVLDQRNAKVIRWQKPWRLFAFWRSLRMRARRR